MGRGWDDAGDIARRLHDRFPDRDPLTVRPVDIERRAREVAGVTAPDPPTPLQVEAIQERWYEAYGARQPRG